MKEKSPEVKKQNESLSFADVSKKVSELWRATSDDDKKKFDALAQKDKIRYAEDKKNAPSEEESSDEGGRKRKKKKQKKTGPKRAMNSYMFYANSKRTEIKTANPTASLGQVTKLIAAKWKTLSADEKKPYEEMSSKDKERYIRETKEQKK